jgi:Tol biopolymer transport system component
MDLTAGGDAKRFTFDAASRRFPVWSPDGRRIVFAHRYANRGTILQKPLDGGTATTFAAAAGQPTDWSRDGRNLLYQLEGDLWVWADGKPVRITQTSANETNGQFSPDGKWISYVSDESKRNEIWVQSFPPSGTKWQVSSTGGTQPRWSRDRKELFYLSADAKLMSIPVHSGGSFEFGAPVALFDAPRINNAANMLTYAVSVDGPRFLMRGVAPDSNRTPVTVLTNWLSMRN